MTRVCVGCGNFLHRPQIVAKLIMKAKELPPLETLREWLRYDPETGNLLWKRTNQGTRGEVAGDSKPNGAGYITINTKAFGGRYQAHRICWALHHQKLPEVYQVIDHINGVKHDNRAVNLRLVTQSANCNNRALRSDNKSGHRGVSWCNTWRRWMVWINVNKVRLYVGRFERLEDAIDARLTAEREHNIHVRE